VKKTILFDESPEQIIVPLVSSGASLDQKRDVIETVCSFGFAKPTIHVDSAKYDQSIFVSNWCDENGEVFKDGFTPSRIVAIDSKGAVLASGPGTAVMAKYKRVKPQDEGLLSMIGRLFNWDAVYARVD
jgi:hypothetical protein